jgi:hypothetical protein
MTRIPLTAIRDFSGGDRLAFVEAFLPVRRLGKVLLIFPAQAGEFPAPAAAGIQRVNPSGVPRPSSEAQ